MPVLCCSNVETRKCLTRTNNVEDVKACNKASLISKYSSKEGQRVIGQSYLQNELAL